MSTIEQDKRFGGIFLDNIVEWVGDNFDPEEVFSEEQLELWAKEQGYEHQIDPG